MRESTWIFHWYVKESLGPVTIVVGMAEIFLLQAARSCIEATGSPSLIY